MKNRILFCGDPHGEFRFAIESVFKYRPEAIVFLGDFGLDEPLEYHLRPIIGLTKIYFIHGNHDTDSESEFNNLFNCALSDNSIHLKVVEVGGLRIAGLGGIFMGRVWRPGDIPKWIDKKHYLHFSPSNMKKIPIHIDNAIWHDEFEHMKKTIKADVLVTHEAPSCHRHGFKVLDELAEAIGAKLIVHGHHHRHYVSKVGEISVACAPIGGVVNLSGEYLMGEGK